MLIDLKKIDREKQDDLQVCMVTAGNNYYPVSRKLEEIFDALGNCENVHWVSNGDWSMHEMLLYTISSATNATVYLSSYGFSELPARTIADLKNAGNIGRLFCLVDNRIDTRSASALSLIQSVADKCVLTDTHAKVTVIETAADQITIIGSANYTSNKRYEAGMITKARGVASFHKKWITDELQRQPA